MLIVGLPAFQPPRASVFSRRWPGGGRRSAPGVGYRALLEAGCLQNTLATIHSPRGLHCPEEVEAIASSMPGQLRGGQGRVVPKQSAHPGGHASTFAIISVKRAIVTTAFLRCIAGTGKAMPKWMQDVHDGGQGGGETLETAAARAKKE